MKLYVKEKVGRRFEIPPFKDLLNWNRVKGRVDLDVTEVLTRTLGTSPG
jgi:hypothetical protein